ncbi:hypothetical protein ABZX75_33375 [Streptomyces sp. NPDC003038]|uniref:hypothetical protein n=1 Tax=unclassified Streptomyces TaxID=2593676 RepID=UPI0033AC554D
MSQITAPESGRTKRQMREELAQVRRQRDQMLAVFGVLLAVGAGLVVRYAPEWGNPAQVAFAAAALYGWVVTASRRT